MRGKSLLAFAMAIGCGLVAMVGVQQVLKKQNVDPDADKVTVFVAATEILPGQTIDMTMLEKRKFLKGSVPMEAVIDPKQLEKRALTCKVMPGDIIRSDKLGAEGRTGASISIPNGMRVVSLPTNTTQAHSGMIQPGDRVDVMVSYRVQPPQGGREYPETKTVLGYIQVFATDAMRDTNSAASGEAAKAAMKNVSLLVTPEQAQVLMMAQSVGQLHLSLRNANDMKEVDITNLTPGQFRDAVVLHGQPNEEPDPSKQDKPQQAEQKTPEDLNKFLDDAAGKPTQVAAAPAPESTTESWDIAFYGKDGVKVETLEIPRRPTPSKVEDQSSTSVMGTLFNMMRPAADRKSATSSRNSSEPATTTESNPDNKKAVEAQPTKTTRGTGITTNSALQTPRKNTSVKSTKALPSTAVTSEPATK